MISKLLYTLERGVNVVKLHTRFLLIGLLLILYFVLVSDFDFGTWWNNYPSEKLTFKKMDEAH